ncbi:MAG: HAD family phosphatase [Bacillota bacterium]|nr:HAD family phosphatase [Bacillota bacterium]
MERAFIFDMDGVIVDSEPRYRDLNRELFKELNVDVDEETRKSFIGGSSTRKWKFMKEKFSLLQSVEELQAFQRERFLKKDWNFQEILFPGAIPLLTLLKKHNIPTALASSSDKMRINMVLEQCHLHDFFDYTISGEDFENGKPFPDIFLAAAKKLTIPPAKCVVIEDSNNGITAAKKANMYCIAVKHKEIEMDITMADKIVNSLFEIDVMDFIFGGN